MNKPSMYELDTTNGWKICRLCKEKLSISQFVLCKSKAKDGKPARAWYEPRCKKCKAAYHKNKWDTDPEYKKRKLARIRKYQESHKEQVRANTLKYVKKWQANNREEFREQMRTRGRIKSILNALARREPEEFMKRYWTEEQIKEAIEKRKK